MPSNAIPAHCLTQGEKPQNTSCIRHRADDQVVVIRSIYYEIVSTKCEAGLIGLFHQDFIHLSKVESKTQKEVENSFFGIWSDRLIRRSLERICTQGWVEKTQFQPHEIEQILRGKTPQVFPGFNARCSWCDSTSVSLQRHHYPIGRSQGGTETVEICANCHFEFHQLEQPIYKASSDLIEWLAIAPRIAGGM